MLPLLDRQAELVVLGQAIEEVAAGEGRVVLVEGGAGAGKTRLVAEAKAQCARAGLRVLSARGGEMEHEYPYGIVRQLFEAPLQDPGDAQWLKGIAATAASVFRPEASVEVAPFATLNGLYWLTVNAAAGGPLALVVDDLHWADRPSLGFLQFVVRRLEGIPVLLIVASRPAEEEVLVDIAASPAAVVLRPGPLSLTAAVQLTHDFLGVPPSERFVAACRHATSGNPLLLVELLRTLRAEGIAPDDAHTDAVEQVGPSAVARIVIVRLRRLGGDALAVARSIAVLGSGADPWLLGAMAQLGQAPVRDAIESLIGAEIIDDQPPLGFVHPIVRDAIYRDLTPDERDRRHARAAELLHARAAPLDQVGAHLMVTAPGGRSWVIDALRAAAADAAQRGAVESAITLLRRAFAERPAEADFDLLYRLGMAEAIVDPRRAVARLQAARDTAPDAPARARIGEMITRMLIFIDPAEGIATARETSRELPPESGDLRAGLLAMERHAGRFIGVESEPYPAEIPDTPRGRMLMAVHVWERSLSGGTAEECAAQAAEVLGRTEGAETRSALTRDTIFTAMVASSVMILADDQRVQAYWDTWYEEAVRAGRAHAAIAGGIWNGLMCFRLGRLTDAEASIRAAMEGPRDWGPGTEAVPAHTVGNLVDTLVERGDLDGARKALGRLPPGIDPRSEGALQSRNAELRLLVAEGRYQEGIDLIEPVRERLQTVLNPAWAPWRSLCAEALGRVGRVREGIAMASEELEIARNWGTPGPIGVALTALGGIEGRTELLEEAVQVTQSPPFARLEHAKALLALGRAVRLGRRPRDARAYLRDADTLATWCGAEAIAQRARDELAAAGGRPRATAGSGTASLTASERRVAGLAAAGRRNRDIAEQLYLSPKTVEVHLSNSYRKLGIRTRAELISVLDASMALLGAEEQE